jgi:hypothetical protein
MLGEDISLRAGRTSCLSLEGAGAMFGMTDLFRRVYDYVKGVQESRQVKEKLKDILLSLNVFASSAKMAEQSGITMVDSVMRLDPPITAPEIEEIMRNSIEFFGQYQLFLSSIRQFGNECNGLVSGDFEGFMERVKQHKPDVHDIITFLGNNYQPKTGTLDMTRLPILIRAWGKKGAWKESKELSEIVAEGKKKVDRAIEIMEKVMKQPKVRVRDRQLIVNYFSSYRRLTREGKHFYSTNVTLKDLRQNAPTWYIDLVGIADNVKDALPGGSKYPPLVDKSHYPRSGSWP